MKINEVAKKTNLTKKAIRYYEQEGIINPLIDENNNYRDYSDEDIKRLLEVNLFRQLDIPIKDIKIAFEKPENLNIILEKHKIKVEEQVKKMERNKNILDTIIESTNHDNSDEMINKLKLLSESINWSNIQKTNYIKEELLRLFPGGYGKIVLLGMAPFFNIKIDSNAKEKAWLEIVKFLDDVSFDYPEGFEDLFKNMPENYLEENHEKVIDAMNRIVNMSEKEKNSYKEIVLDFYEKAIHNNSLKSSYEKNSKLGLDLKKILINNGFYESFINNMVILSDEYRVYHSLICEIQAEINSRFI